MNNVEKPDLRNGVALATVPDEGKILGGEMEKTSYACGAARNSLSWAVTVRTTAGRSRTGWWVDDGTSMFAYAGSTLRQRPVPFCDLSDSAENDRIEGQKEDENGAASSFLFLKLASDNG